MGKPSTAGLGFWSHLSWCQPRPRIHSPGPAFWAASLTIATTSSQFLTFVRFRVIRAWPTPVKWPWPSMKPGMASRPRRSTTRVWGPMYGATSSFVPTATIVSPRAASACPSGFPSSTVTILPWLRTRVAGSTFGLPAQARGRKAGLASKARVHARRHTGFSIGLVLIDPPSYPSSTPHPIPPHVGGGQTGAGAWAPRLRPSSPPIRPRPPTPSKTFAASDGRRTPAPGSCPGRARGPRRTLPRPGRACSRVRSLRPPARRSRAPGASG